MSAEGGSQATALHYAARKNHGEMIDTLVEAGATATVHAQNTDGCTLLREEARISSYDVVLTLLKHGPDVNAEDHRDRSPLYFAASKKGGNIGSAQVVNLLLKGGADEKIVATDGRSPACVTGHGVIMLDRFTEDAQHVR